MAEKNYKKAKARWKKDYDKYVLFEPCFAASDYVFVERSLLMKSATDRIAFKGYSKLLPIRTGPYRLISVGCKYAEMNQDGI